MLAIVQRLGHVIQTLGLLLAWGWVVFVYVMASHEPTIGANPFFIAAGGWVALWGIGRTVGYILCGGE